MNLYKVETNLPELHFSVSANNIQDAFREAEERLAGWTVEIRCIRYRFKI